MKRILAVCSAFVVLAALSVMASAQSKGANFAGTWELDKSKSKLPQQMADNVTSMTWTVVQTDKEVTREQKMEGTAPGGGGGGRGMGGGGPLTVKLDGSEAVTETQRGKRAVKAKWQSDGKILEMTTVNSNGDRTTTSTEHWELADGGKTLKVHQMRETQNGPMESSLVFTKK
ncbi:MAG: hypothetical protein M3X11_10720 [Acidobacteriota bacterium]|nr:hypothetical protein [Acidobacteriota bacterium]